MDNLTQNPCNIPAPSLPPTLLTLYSGLNEENKQVFYKVFKFLWGELLPVHKFTGYSGLLYSFWAVDLVQRYSGLASSSWAVLSYLYQITKHNKRYVKSIDVYESSILPGVLTSTKQKILSSLVVAGYVVRSFRDPDNPHYKKSFLTHPCFVRLSPSGVRLIETFEKDLYKILINSSFEDLSGTQKKPRKNSRAQ